jgi:hypothetical protein
MAVRLTIWPLAPADQIQIALACRIGQAKQFAINKALLLNLPPEPGAILSDHFLAGTVFADFLRIAKEAWSSDVNSSAAVRTIVDYCDHRNLSLTFNST